MPHVSRPPRPRELPAPAAARRGLADLRLLPLALILAVAAAAAPATAQIYRWTDANGTVHFTDSLHTVPPEHRPKVGTMDDRLPAPAPVREVPLRQGESGYTVEARIDGSGPVSLVLDTGATSTVLSPRVAERLGLAVSRDPPVLVRTAGGTVEAGAAQVREIEVGGHRAGPLQVVIHDAVAGADGLLGMNFLGLFHVEIRADGPSLILSPP